jgi:hypothetical protein
MQSMGERLVSNVQQFQQSTGEDSMMVVIEKRDESMGIHKVGFDPRLDFLWMANRHPARGTSRRKIFIPFNGGLRCCTETWQGSDASSGPFAFQMVKKI